MPNTLQICVLLGLVVVLVVVCWVAVLGLASLTQLTRSQPDAHLYHERNVCGRLVDKFPHPDTTEWGERCIARMFTPEDAVVLELGGGNGSVSAVIQERLLDKTKHAVVQPKHDQSMFGGYDALVETKHHLGLQFTIVDHVLEPGEQQDIIAKMGQPTVLVADCENCLVGEYQKNPLLFVNLKMIQVERDDFDKSYDELLSQLNMYKVYSGYGCGGGCATEVWLGPNR